MTNSTQPDTLSETIQVGTVAITPREERYLDVSLGDKTVTIDTDRMTREEVSQAIVVAASMLETPPPNRKQRRMARTVH